MPNNQYDSQQFIPYIPNAAVLAIKPQGNCGQGLRFRVLHPAWQHAPAATNSQFHANANWSESTPTHPLPANFVPPHEKPATWLHSADTAVFRHLGAVGGGSPRDQPQKTRNIVTALPM